MPVNPILMQQVKQALFSKRAFMPPGGGGAPPPPGGAPPPPPPMDPAMMGGAPPPMDPAMMGGAPPPMDPAMMGGAPPPMDPAMMGGAPPPPPPPPPPPQHDPNQIRQLIQEEIQKSMTGGGADGAKAKGKGAKVDPAQMIEYMDRQQKLLINLYQSLGLNLPYDILDKPKNPEEGGDTGQDAAGAPPPSSSDMSGIPPIKPIEPIGGKQASVFQKAQAMRYMLSAINRKV